MKRLSMGLGALALLLTSIPATAQDKLVVSNVNAFTLFACGDTYHPTWIESDPARREQRIQHTLRCIDLAFDFGARTISPARRRRPAAAAASAACRSS